MRESIRARVRVRERVKRKYSYFIRNVFKIEFNLVLLN